MCTYCDLFHLIVLGQIMLTLVILFDPLLACAGNRFNNDANDHDHNNESLLKMVMMIRFYIALSCVSAFINVLFLWLEY